ncbi:MAG: Orotidine 5'-phosphate decarboxylase [Nitrosopumilales archaeon]|nr:MAG: Orotidine 5'-phosphate decarboxylase [Nitrosopumilales archaeon]
MTKFKTRIKQISKKKGRIILANDYPSSLNGIESKTISNIKKLNQHLCGLKLNFHLLLRLGSKEIIKINKTAHQYNLQTIADIKLNDIGATNQNTTEILWKLGFDAVIVNPIMGQSSLRNIISSAHKNDKGVISLCHMSAPEAKLTYEMNVNLPTKKQTKLYQLFLDWAISLKADGIIAGATFPKIIKYCKQKTGKDLAIYSPGVGTQGGKIKDVLSAGSDFLIVGRTILNSKNPIETAKKLQLQSIN